MYLHDLNDAQKALTMDLMLHMLPEDRRGSPDGQSRIRWYCSEMGIVPRFAPLLDEDTALKQLTQISSTITLRKVFIELAILAMSCTEYEKLEQKFTDKYAVLTGLQRSVFDEVLHLLEEISYACQRLGELVNIPG
ncbi:MAG: hypothetical protein IKE62_00795 [Oscillospiraceae bacterium]|nr:hypothetical protein [Oscillospiraceae bacterium]